MIALASAAVAGRMLKVGFGELVAQVGGLEAAAACCRVSKTALGRYASLSSQDADYFAPVDVVRCLEAVAGAPLVTRLLATAADHLLVAPPAVAATGVDLFTLLASQQREASDLTGALALGIGDGRICGDDARKALAEARQLAGVVAAMIAELELIVREDGA